MDDFILSCCSPADLSKEKMEEYDIKYISFKYELDGVTYLDDLGKTISYDEFYRRMFAGAETSTNHIYAKDYKEYFRPFLQAGKDILHISLSSGLSGTYNSCMMAKGDLEEEFPKRKIYVVDSLGASGGIGLMMMTLSQMKADGAGIEELYNFIEANKLRMQHWFFSTDLKFYIRGGRVTATSGFLGNMFRICPLLNMSNDGLLKLRKNVFTKEKVKKLIVKQMIMHAEGGSDYTGKVYITQSLFMEDANDVAALVREAFPKVTDISIGHIGATIGSHTGPGTLAMFFWGDMREE